ncbi:MAG: hypothetical protein JRI43_04240 [Deltaproteobacteria bacterium]|nr:hypothetical protein [Deltaproteobacteria bacterium]
MKKINILFFSGSVGLGHINRDIAIANELRRQYPHVEISWLAISPASDVLLEAGEHLLPASKLLSDENKTIEDVQKSGHHLNVINYLIKTRKGWNQNFKVYQSVTEQKHFDLFIGDETFEISMTLVKKPALKKLPFVFILDYIGLDPTGPGLKEKLIAYLVNRRGSKDYHPKNRVMDLTLFVGELEDVPDKSFGFLLPNRRDYAKKTCQFIGHILPFSPSDFIDTIHIRNKLGYGEAPLIVCSVGGTAVGKEILELCGQTYPIVKQHIPNLRMLLVAGPRLSADSIDVPQGVEVTGYVPGLHEHFAASDLAIVQGGGTITLELTALRKPFIYFPLEGNYEHEVIITERLNRHRAGVKMMYSNTTPKTLAEQILSNMGKDVDYASIPLDGAQKAVQLISKFF